MECEEDNICTEGPENSIYLMENLRVGNSNCLTFFDSGANAHLIDGQMARQEDLQLISNKSVALIIIGGGSIRLSMAALDLTWDLGKMENIMKSLL